MADSLLKEIDEALRADRAAALWNRHKFTLIAGAVALVVAAAANSVWQHHRQARGGELLLQLSNAKELLDKGKAGEAASAFKTIAQDAHGDVKALALVWQARALIGDHKQSEAIAALKAAITDGHGLWSDIACLRLAGLDSAAAEPCLSDSTASPLAAVRAQWSAAHLWAKGDDAAATAALEAQLASPTTDSESKAQLSAWLASITSHGTKAGQ